MSITKCEGEEGGQGAVQNPDLPINALLTCFQEQRECNKNRALWSTLPRNETMPEIQTESLKDLSPRNKVIPS